MYLEDLFIGYNDGKREARLRENFEDYYFNYNGIYEKILEKDKYLVLGRKGTGKTLLAEYVRKKLFNESNSFCELCSCRSFRFKDLFSLKTKDLKPNEYTSIWEWLLLIKLAKILIKDNCAEEDAVSKLKKFFDSCFLGYKLDDMNKIVEITKSSKITGGLLSKYFSLNGEGAKTIKEVNCTYLDYLDDLRSTVLQALSTSQSRYILIFDELDDQFRNEELYKSNIISLIKIVDKLNLEFLENDISVKFVLMLRTDIFYILNDSDLNKIEQDCSVKIDWGIVSNEESPLVKMILLKIGQSIEKRGFQKLNDLELKEKFFPEGFHTPRKIYKPFEFLLARTFLRPRDIITFLRLVVEKYPRKEYFSEQDVRSIEREYSEYLLKEIKNEMHGHVDENIINAAFTLLRQYKRKNFTYEKIEKYYFKNIEIYKQFDLKNLLKLLFDFGVIGNTWNDKNITYYSWNYRENTTIDYQKNFNIHIGLRKALNIS